MQWLVQLNLETVVLYSLNEYRRSIVSLEVRSRDNSVGDSPFDGCGGERVLAGGCY